MAGVSADQGEAPPLSSESSHSSIRRVFPLSRCLFTDLQTQSVFCKVSFPGEISCRWDGMSDLPVCIPVVLFIYLSLSYASYSFICLSPL